MTRTEALGRIRHLAGDSDKVVFLFHATRRMRERNITRSQVVKLLRGGGIVEGPALDLKGAWRCTLRRFAAGEDVTAVVAIRDDRLLVVTAY